jgi:hypothetical protein
MTMDCIHKLASVGDIQVVEYLLSQGSEINRGDEVSQSDVAMRCQHP